MSTAKKNPAVSLVWFEVPTDDMERAKTFYGKLFGWNIAPFPGMAGGEQYLHIDTGGPDASPDGGMMSRKGTEHRTTHYVGVASVAKAAAKVEKLGGKICMPKTGVPGMGYFAVCLDTEGNSFGLWERNEKAK